MKLAFIGTHGVGKTTLCFDLAARMKRLDLNVELVREVARGCPLPINQDTTLDAQAWILHSQIVHEISASAVYGAVICDRSVLDNYAYMVHRVGRRKEYDALIRAWVESYDGLFKVPIIQAPTFDGMRDLSSTFQSEIDELIDELVEVFHVKSHTLDSRHREAWIDDVLEGMGLPTEPPQINLFG